jgi:hypothetical protein
MVERVYVGDSVTTINQLYHPQGGYSEYDFAGLRRYRLLLRDKHMRQSWIGCI